MIEWEFQKAIYARLSGDATLAGLGVAVVDISGQPDPGDPEAAFPRVEIGYQDAREWDTKTETGLDLLLRIHTYSASGSMREPREIQGRIYELLHRDPAGLSLPAGLRLVLLVRESSFVDRDPDRVLHGVCEYRALIEAL